MGPRTLPSFAPSLQRCQGLGWLNSLISSRKDDSAPLAKSVPGLSFPTMFLFYVEDVTHGILAAPGRQLELRFHID